MYIDLMQLIEVVKFGLPHCRLVVLDETEMHLRVLWYGLFDITAIGLDGYPVLLVTRPGMEMDWQTGKVLACLDSVLDEVMGEAPWPDQDAMRRRLQDFIDGEDSE